MRCELTPKSIFELSSMGHSTEASESQLGYPALGVSLMEDAYEVS